MRYTWGINIWEITQQYYINGYHRDMSRLFDYFDNANVEIEIAIL